MEDKISLKSEIISLHYLIFLHFITLFLSLFEYKLRESYILQTLCVSDLMQFSHCVANVTYLINSKKNSLRSAPLFGKKTWPSDITFFSSDNDSQTEIVPCKSSVPFLTAMTLVPYMGSSLLLW